MAKQKKAAVSPPKAKFIQLVAAAQRDGAVLIALDAAGGVWQCVEGGKGWLPLAATRLTHFVATTVEGTSKDAARYDAMEALWRDDSPINVIKTYRSATGVDLKTAKDAVDSMRGQLERMRAAIRSGRTSDAAKLYHEIVPGADAATFVHRLVREVT